MLSFSHALVFLHLLEEATSARLTHLNLDGVVIPADRVKVPGSNGHDLWWSGSTNTTAATRDITYAQLQDEVCRAANALLSLGVRAHDQGPGVVDLCLV